jgi:hypothetical protein
MDLRIRLELLGAGAFDRACQPTQPGEQSRTRARLLCLLHGVPDADLERKYRLIHHGAHVYERTSDVLHGRLVMINLPPAVVDEWRAVVEDLEALGETAQDRQRQEGA